MTELRELSTEEMGVVSGGEKKSTFTYIAPGAGKKDGNPWTDWIYDNYNIVVAKADRYAF
jgi:hypothetical protein